MVIVALAPDKRKLKRAKHVLGIDIRFTWFMIDTALETATESNAWFRAEELSN